VFHIPRDIRQNSFVGSHIDSGFVALAVAKLSRHLEQCLQVVTVLAAVVIVLATVTVAPVATVTVALVVTVTVAPVVTGTVAPVVTVLAVAVCCLTSPRSPNCSQEGEGMLVLQRWL